MKNNEATELTTYEDLKKSKFCMMYFARGCRDERHARGLCNRHYHMVLSCVKNGIFTWEKLEKQLKALPIKPRECKIDLIENLSK